MDENKPRRRWLSFGMRDLLWLFIVVALCLALWREKRQSQKLAAEVQYHTSAVPQIALVKVPIDQAVWFVGAKHQMMIDLDWPSLEKAGVKRDELVTHNLVDGSLTWAIKRIFLGKDVVVEGAGPQRLIVRGRVKGEPQRASN